MRTVPFFLNREEAKQNPYAHKAYVLMERLFMRKENTNILHCHLLSDVMKSKVV